MRATGQCLHLLPLGAAGMGAEEHAGFCEPRCDGLICDDLVQLFSAVLQAGRVVDRAAILRRARGG